MGPKWQQIEDEAYKEGRARKREDQLDEMRKLDVVGIPRPVNSRLICRPKSNNIVGIAKRLRQKMLVLSPCKRNYVAAHLTTQNESCSNQADAMLQNVQQEAFCSSAV